MRNYSNAGNIARIVFLLFFIIALMLGGLVWLDFLGVLNLKDRLAPITAIFGIPQRHVVDEPFSPMLLDSDRLAKERQAISFQKRELKKSEEELAFREVQLLQKESEVAEREGSLEERRNSLSEALNQYDNRKANLEQTARYMANMPPTDAVAIMEEYDLNDLVDLLRTSEGLSQENGEASLVAYWLSLMSDRNRAAEVQRLMVEKPGLSLNE